LRQGQPGDTPVDERFERTVRCPLNLDALGDQHLDAHAAICRRSGLDGKERTGHERANQDSHQPSSAPREAHYGNRTAAPIWFGGRKVITAASH